MKRDIEFRGLYKGVWVYGNLLLGVDMDGEELTQIELTDPRDYHQWSVDRKTVGQYTGLTDKNGENKVFESDKVDYEYWIQTSPDPESLGKQFSGIGIIVYIEGAFMVEDVETKHRIPLHYPDLSVEVIGNIFEGN